MSRLEVIGIRSHKIVDWGDSIIDIFIESLVVSETKLKNRDVVSITSKVFSMQEKAAVEINTITPSNKAKELAEKTSIDARVAQLVIDESNDQIFGGVYKAILAKTDYGLSANAGIDQSNCPTGYALLLPKNPDSLAQQFRQQIKERLGVDVAVVIIDSRTIPLKRGTTAIAIGVAGMRPVIDERGKKDLYGYTMTITSRAVADNVATTTNLVMGETDERMPFAIVRGLNYIIEEDVSMTTTLMPEDQCLYFAPLLELKNKVKD